MTNLQDAVETPVLDDMPIETEAFFWLVTCLSLIKVVDEQEWGGLVARISRDEELGCASISGVLDETLASLCGKDKRWMPIASSLCFREIVNDQEVKKALNVVESHAKPRELFSYLIERFVECNCFVAAGEDPSANIPESVAVVMVGFAKILSEVQHGSPAAIYLTPSCSHALVRNLRRAFPGAALCGQDFSWRNICEASMLSILDGSQPSFAIGPAIVDDAFADSSEFPLAISVFPHGRIFNAEIVESDPRWIYCAPQQGREGYAWFQQALYHIDESGFAVLCAPTGVLTTTHVKEFPMRRDLVKEGRVYAAATLPGRLFHGSSNVAHLLVVGPKRPAQADDDCPMLFIDAQEMGQRLDGSFERTIGEDVVGKIVGTFQEYMGGGRPREIRFAALAQPADILDSNCDLTPSSYVYTPEKITSNDPQILERGLFRLVGELEEAASAVASLDAELLALLKGVL